MDVASRARDVAGGTGQVSVKAIVQDGYGSPGVLVLRDIEMSLRGAAGLCRESARYVVRA
jgi:hypothetical protein